MSFSCDSSVSVSANFDNSEDTIIAHNILAPYQSEIIVRTINNIHTFNDIDVLVGHAITYNIATITIAFKQDEDDENTLGPSFL